MSPGKRHTFDVYCINEESKSCSDSKTRLLLRLRPTKSGGGWGGVNSTKRQYIFNPSIVILPDNVDRL